MPVSVVIGGQFGSEGKGKVAHFLAKTQDAKAAIRVGGSNSGHTIFGDGNKYVLRLLPTAAILPDVKCILPAGSYIDPRLLLEEIAITGIAGGRISIDPFALIVDDADVSTEHQERLATRIGSTSVGIGSALARRVLRREDLKFAKDIPELSQFIQPVIPLLRQMLDLGDRLILEGTQGFGLSLLHSQLYPFTTSRDTTAAAFLSETGLSPFDVDCIALVIRSFPIRVAGNSGPLPNELCWRDVTKRSGAGENLIEFTSVTKNVRRVGDFDAGIVKQAIAVNRPTHIFLNHVDYFDMFCKGKTEASEGALKEIRLIEKKIGQNIDFIGTSEVLISPLK